MRHFHSAARAASILLLAAALSGCASKHATSDNAMGGVFTGAVVGGTVGAVCCGNPVVGLPAGALIGGVAGGAAGLIWPSKHDDEYAY